LFPEWLERKTRVWEDNFIFQVQAFLNGPTLLFTRLLKVTHTLWFGFTATLFFYFAGCDRFSQLWASYLSVLLVVVLGIKRFLWRHRPFAVKRARLILTSSSSSFPSRSVLCVIVYSYLFYQMAQMAWEDHLKIHALNIIPSLLLPLVFLAMGGGLTVTTSLVEILVGVHYPTDCIGSAILAVPIIFLGGLVHSASSSHCPVVTISYIQSKRNGDVELPFLEEKMFQRDTLIKWGLFGACLSVLLAQRFALNWKKMYRALG
jgi:membrane-associated phospholipid phosphatase